MTGVEILTSTQFATGEIFNMTACWIFAIIVLLIIMGTGIAIAIGTGDFDFIRVVIVCSLSTGLIAGMMGGTIYAIPTDYETHYKITISDEVSMTEFYEHYEVIEQDGKIFTVREVDDNEE